jgi:hypothetical protein
LNARALILRLRLLSGELPAFGGLPGIPSQKVAASLAEPLAGLGWLSAIRAVGWHALSLIPESAKHKTIGRLTFRRGKDRAHSVW